MNLRIWNRGDFGVFPELHEKRERRFLVSETVFDFRENGARVAAVRFPRHEILAVFLRRFEIADPKATFESLRRMRAFPGSRAAAYR